jgi:nitroreductase
MNTNLIEDMKWRYATKEFDKSKTISDEDLEVVLESLRLTPSSFGLQPWKFVLVKNEAKREELVEASWGQKQVAESSHLIVLCSPLDITEADVDTFVDSVASERSVDRETLKGYRDMMVGFLSRKDEKQRKEWMKNQSYIALGNLMTTCATLRIDACPMEGFLPSKYTEILGLKEKGLRPILVCPIGYRSNDDKYAEIAKVRFSKKDVVEYID